MARRLFSSSPSPKTTSESSHLLNTKRKDKDNTPSTEIMDIFSKKSFPAERLDRYQVETTAALEDDIQMRSSSKVTTSCSRCDRGSILERKLYKSLAEIDSASAVSEAMGTYHTDISSSNQLGDRDQMPSTSAKPHNCLLCGDDRAHTHCARCKVARYCSRKCQIKHWRAGHKFECKNYKSPSSLDSTSMVSEIRGSDHMGRNQDQMPTAPASGDFCFVCGDWSDIRCSRCKAIGYCSQACETKHWREGHKLECKENKSPADECSAYAVSGRRDPGHVGTSSSMYQRSKKDGKLADTVQSPKKISSKELPSVEECPICFSTIHTSEPSCPLLACDVCNNKFHSSCLLKWFSTSKKSRCPLCQNLFSNRKVQP